MEHGVECVVLCGKRAHEGVEDLVATVQQPCSVPGPTLGHGTAGLVGQAPELQTSVGGEPRVCVSGQQRHVVLSAAQLGTDRG
jgi:hypothetical protein